MVDKIEEIGMRGGFDNERWGLPTKNERYSRVKDREKYIHNLEESNIGKDVNPALARKFHKVYTDVKKDM